MFAQERHEQILDLVRERRRLTVAEVEASLGTSPATTRRDLAAMEQRGLIIRVHGGVLYPEAVRGEASFQKRHVEAIREKQEIAATAAGLVQGSAAVYVDAGTTCYEVARLLVARPELTLYTNSVPVMASAWRRAATIVGIGGELRDVSSALVGDIALRWLGNLHFDIAFIGASGLTAKEGAAATALSEASVKRAVLSRSERAVLVADSGKWNVARPVHFAPWSAFSAWVTDAGIRTKSRHRERPSHLEIIIGGREK